MLTERSSGPCLGERAVGKRRNASTGDEAYDVLQALGDTPKT